MIGLVRCALICSLLALGTAACDDRSHAAVVDAGADAGADDASFSLSPPARPNFGACPSSFSPGEITSPQAGKVTVCRATRVADASSCAQGTFPFLGSSECQPVGPPCPVGPFADDLPDDRTLLFVLAGATSGEGSKDKPFATIKEANDVAVPGTTIVVGKGTYDEIVFPRVDDVEVLGACPAQTHLTSTTAEFDAYAPVVFVSQGRVGLRNVSISSPLHAGVAVFEEGDLDLRDVIIDGVTWAAVHVTDGASVRVSNAAFVAVRPDAEGHGAALDIRKGSSVQINHAVIIGSASELVRLQGTDATTYDAKLEASDLYLEHRPSAEQSETASLVLTSDASLKRVFLYSESRAAMQTAANVTIEDVEFARNGGLSGVGVGATAGSIRMQRVLFDQWVGYPIVGRSASIELLDAVIAHSRGGEGEETTLTVPVSVGSAGSLSAERVLLSQNANFGVWINGPGTTAALTDITVVDSQNVEVLSPHALRIDDQAHVTLQRGEFRANPEGIFVFDAARLEARDVVVGDSTGIRHEFEAGTGLIVAKGSHAELESFRTSSVRSFGVTVFDDSTLRAEGLEILQTKQQVCNGSCGDETFGIGMMTTAQASIVASNFVIAESALSAIAVFDDGNLTLKGGVVRDGPVGIHITGDFDPANLGSEVQFIGIDRNIVRESIPEPATPLPATPPSPDL